MIRIFKDKDIKIVTKGAYETIFKPLGYNVVLEETNKKISKKAFVDTTIKNARQNKTVTSSKKGSFKKNKKED